MSEARQYEVTKLSRASFAEDFSSVEVEFELADGTPLQFKLKPASLSQITSKLSEFLTFIQTQGLSIGDHFEVHASEVEDVTAVAAAGGSKVILSIKGTNGVINHFALPVSAAAQFRSELKQAVRSAEKQSKQTRQ